MLSTRSTLLVPIALAALLLTGCTGQNAQPSGGQTPEQVDDGAILVALEQVDPGLNTQDSIADADEICADIDEGVDSEEIDEHAQELFSDQAESPLSIEQARQVVQVLLIDYCV